jgi:hypothetical protein
MKQLGEFVVSAVVGRWLVRRSDLPRRLTNAIGSESCAATRCLVLEMAVHRMQHRGAVPKWLMADGL